MAFWWLCSTLLLYPQKGLAGLSKFDCMCRNQNRSNDSQPTRQGQKQPRDRGFNPRDWEGSSSSSVPSSSSRQPPQQRPHTKSAEPSSRPERTAARWQDGNKPSAAGVPGLDDEAGLDEWEPTGAGRKGWYNPQASPSSAAASKETRPVTDPLLNSPSGSGDRWSREGASGARGGELLNIGCAFNLLQVVWWDAAERRIMHGIAPAAACTYFKRS